MMQNLAKKLEPAEATQLSGYVVRVEGGGVVVRADRGELRARRAMSCLLDPALGDRVLVAVVEDGSAFVLAVLERQDDGAAAVTMDRDLAFRLPSGRFDVVAKDGVGLVSTGEVSVVAGGVEVKAVDGRLSIDRITALGRHLLAEVANVKVVAGAIDSVLDRFTQRVKRSHRIVEEMDQVRAERIDYSAEKSMHLYAENALVTAEELVKLDGENVHLG